MGIEQPDVTSGHESDNATKAQGLDDAISAAVDASELPLTSDSESETTDVKASDTAGDDVNGEDVAVEEVEPSLPLESETSLEPIEHWPDDLKETFTKVGPEDQQAMLTWAKELEGGFTRKSQKLSDDSKFAETVRGLLDDATKTQLKQNGADELGYFQYLDGLQKFASRDPIGYVKWAMQNLSVSQDQLGLPQTSQAEQPAANQQYNQSIDDLLVDPAVKQIQAELERVNSKLAERERFEKDLQHREYTAQVQSNSNVIKSFREAIDDNGQIKYPHFDAASQTMGELMNANPELKAMPDGLEKMQKAYDMAVWALPDTRAEFLEREAAKKAEALAKAKDVSRAKRVVGVKPAAGVVDVHEKPSTLDEALDAAIAQHGH